MRGAVRVPCPPLGQEPAGFGVTDLDDEAVLRPAPPHAQRGTGEGRDRGGWVALHQREPDDLRRRA